MRPPLWLNVEGAGARATVSLARCRNCGKTKVASDPCGLDHLAALMEFRATNPAHDEHATDGGTDDE